MTTHSSRKAQLLDCAGPNFWVMGLNLNGMRDTSDGIVVMAGVTYYTVTRHVRGNDPELKRKDARKGRRAKWVHLRQTSEICFGSVPTFILFSRLVD
jgi:hypothetical protein